LFFSDLFPFTPTDVAYKECDTKDIDRRTADYRNIKILHEKIQCLQDSKIMAAKPPGPGRANAARPSGNAIGERAYKIESLEKQILTNLKTVSLLANRSVDNSTIYMYFRLSLETVNECWISIKRAEQSP